MAKQMAVRGDELKKLLKLGKKRPMPFAFCPSGGDDDNVLIIHRKRQPEMLGKIARKEGEGTKIAYGTFTMKGKQMTLTCERELAGLAKRMKRHMKLEKMPMNIVVLDMSGQELESDIEDLGEDDQFDDDDNDDLDDVEENDDEDDLDLPDDEDDPAYDTSELFDRAKEAKAGVEALPGDFGVKLTKALALGVQAVKSGNFAAADKAIATVEAALGRMAGATAPDAPPPPPEASAPPPPPPPPGAASPEALAMVQRINKAKAAAETLGGETGAKVLGFLPGAAQAVKSQDFEKAGTVMDAVEKALDNAKKAAAEKAQADAAAAREALPDAPEPTTPEGKEWQTQMKRLMPLIDQALKDDKGDISGMSASWAMATERADNGDFEGALAIVPRLDKLLEAAKQATQKNSEKQIPEDVVPFVKSRISWIDTRRKLQGEIGKLKSAIDKSIGSIEGMEDVAKETGSLFKHLDNLDDRLEDALEALVEEPDGEARERKKNDVRSIISDYEAELDSDFFKDVDANNGFVSVSVRSTAVSALKSVSAALS